jgi:hypothetical protein
MTSVEGSMSASRAFVSGLFLSSLLVAPGVTGAAADETQPDTPPAAEGKTETVVISKQYTAGGFHCWLWGKDYRTLWAAPIQIQVLDLHNQAGGLKPVRRVGGNETKGLAMKGADGRDYTFRSIDKDPTGLLPEDLKDTWVKNIIQDSIAANHPASFFVVDELLEAAGILRTAQTLVVMPDDPLLGEFQKDFAGAIGQFFEFPQAKTTTNPGFEDASEILRYTDFYKGLNAGGIQVNAKALLKARLVDILIGDWDRHVDQWRWAKFPGKEAWEPVPEDRDQAFSRYEGVVLDLVRQQVPRLQNYSAKYPSMFGLTLSGWEQDRQILAGLDRATWKAVATELQSQITDEVIQRAVHRMPAEYYKIDGARLAHDLTGRRDRLQEGADAFYRHISDKVKVYLTDQPEYVEAKWIGDGNLLLQVWRDGPDGKPAGDPVYKRTLYHKETQEVQVYLRGGDDKVVTLGKPGGVTLRVIGFPGHDVVDDTKGGGTHFYDPSGGDMQKGPGSSFDTKTYTPPATSDSASASPPRDWGRDYIVVPWLSYSVDLGVFAGVSVDTQGHAFRKDPFGNRQVLRAGWAFGESTARADYLAKFNFENSPWYVGWYALASGIETSRFFGLGNETSDGGDPKSDFYKAKSAVYSFTPAVGRSWGKIFTAAIGPTIKYGQSTHKDDNTLINEEQPFGYGNFGELGATAVLNLDARKSASKDPGGVQLRSIGYPIGGVQVLARGQVFPKAWDVPDTFGSVNGSVATYLTPGSDKAPTLALRVGGEKVFGNYPYFEAAYLGGGSSGVNAEFWEGTVRGLPRHRYAGDGMVYGNADLRIYISHFHIFLPGTWGILGFGDSGRVYYAGEDSNKWHYGYGGGLWFAFLDRSNTLSFTYARSEGANTFYFRAGFAF